MRGLWRAGVMVALVTILITAQFLRADHWFPLGSLGQYAYPRDRDQHVVNTYVTGITTTGREVRVGLTPGSAGISRVEFENYLPEIHDDASLLGDIVDAWEMSHPPNVLVSVTVRQQISPLSGGALGAEPYDVVVLHWEVP
ncbi:hypothetical protein [Ruania halotolerans]|uniref:hypothetical protein n=1 Tax=Ruania halotolerans TaxID=2897773 RepID=UPI001E5566BD|nr:hypothetical protein [Ruania halotolerans]UFU06050.1 hypothetical protein LQF10_16730 [Ruania halotolerans]